MQAIILAAGMGKRLKELTKDNTKCMVEVDGVRIIDRMLSQLETKKLSKIIIVTGYKKEQLKEHINSLQISTPIVYIDNDDYNKTNNIYSLSLAKEYLLAEDSLLLESDIVFEDKVLDALLDDERETLTLVDKYESWMDGTCVRLDDNGRIVDFISGRNFDFNNTVGCYKTVNIYKFSREFSQKRYVPFLEAYLTAMGLNEYYEQVLRVIASLDDAEIWGKCLSGEKWYEIDNIQDLDIANSIFCKDAQSKLKRMKNRYGGYWRFTDVQDYCYLVNPYYPPKKMLDEMRASFDMLVTEYPSGMAVNSMLAGKMFGIPSQYIAVGNGASELIKALTGSLIGKVGVIKPTFDEYVNRIDESNIEVYNPDKEDYQYTCEDIVSFFANKDVSSILLINPDNPSGNYLCYNDLKKLIAWAKGKSVSLIIDESFSDFANEPDNSLLNTEVLNQYDKLYVVKSISKSYGVPGLRLGVIASSDSDMISNIKKDVSIWNINSLAEFYMQICEKYEKDYDLAMEEFRRERERFVEELSMISWLHVIPTQANFCMLRLLNGMTAKELSQKLLTQFNILIKDLSEKLERDDYVRIAIKDTESNNQLLNALNSINI